MYLIFDTETTGLPKDYNAPISDLSNWPRVVQIAWQLHDSMGRLLEARDYLIYPGDFDIPFESEKIHGISTSLARDRGRDAFEVFSEFNSVISKAQYIVGQNITFDINVMGSEFIRHGISSFLDKVPTIDTCTELTAGLCQIPGGKGGGFKYPQLSELHNFLFGFNFSQAHNATADVEATARCFFELLRRQKGLPLSNFSREYLDEFRVKNPDVISPVGLKHIDLKKESEKLVIHRETVESEISPELEKAEFCHLHNHTQFTRLQAKTSVQELVDSTIGLGMRAVALTDTGNIMGAFKFVSAIFDYNKKIVEQNKILQQEGKPTKHTIKPIVGCEFFLCRNHLDHKTKDDGYQVVVLAKNKRGYHNIVKLASKSHTDGFYYVPRIDRDLILRYKEDLIILSGNINGEIPRKILSEGIKQAEQALLWWKQHFGDDFYLELNRHGNIQEEQVANQHMINLAKKHSVKIVATNDTFYINQEDASTLDVLLCIKNGEKLSTPIGKGRGKREGMANDQYFFKSQQQMKKAFSDIPEAIINISEIVDKIEPYPLSRDILLPKFNIPKEFEQENDPTGKKGEEAYLRYLTYQGAKKKYGEITDELAQRIDFELDIVGKTGYPGYLLIVYDFVRAAREMDIGVGPGRGSAAGSVVVYCLGITDVDPMQYNLLFERFLNPERVSMPDIDLDFDDKDRSKVIDYVIEKYGANQVSQIITYGTIASKSAINDTARVMDLSSIAPMITKNMPTNPKGWKIKRLLSETDTEAIKANTKTSEDLGKLQLFRDMASSTSDQARIINQAQNLEGVIRNTGVHACGVIITPEDITNYVPVTKAKDSTLWVTQFDNSVVESAGLLKMDFLGLNNLSIIKEALRLIKINHGIDIDIKKISKSDKKTYELFQRGETVGLFQYESVGMQKYMKQLKPTVFEDLIAMNALYRPGPIEYIPDFIERKNGRQTITYDIEDMKEYLEETYGITVYQEQVMLLSQKLADFTKGEADNLRKAMGKKKADVLAKMKDKFMQQAEAKGYPIEKLNKIWGDWESFASYAFNKSHATCYAWLAYQTAYLKANYPSEYMAALLTNNMSKSDSISFYLDECQRMGIEVLPPDVNESYFSFWANKQGSIRFGLGAVKGLARAAIDTIVESRKEKKYTSVADFLKKINLKAANKKALEIIACAGALDSISKVTRAQLLYVDEEKSDKKSEVSYLEKLYGYNLKLQESSSSYQTSLFGEEQQADFVDIEPPKCPQWSEFEKLQREKAVVGIYLSGHPLDQYKNEIKYMCNEAEYDPDNLQECLNKTLNIAGVVADVRHAIFKSQDPSRASREFVFVKIEGYDNTYEFKLTKTIYNKCKDAIEINNFVFVSVNISKQTPFNKNPNELSPQQQAYLNKPRVNVIGVNPLSKIYALSDKKLNIWAEIKDINREFIDNLKEITTKYKGKDKFCINIYQEQIEEQKKQDDGQEDQRDDDAEERQEVEVEEREEQEEKNGRKTHFQPIDYSKREILCRMQSKGQNSQISLCKEVVETLVVNGFDISIQ